MLRENELETHFNHITIEDLCPSLSFRKLKELKKNSDSLTAIEEVVDIDLNVIKGLNTNKIHSSKK